MTNDALVAEVERLKHNEQYIVEAMKALGQSVDTLGMVVTAILDVQDAAAAAQVATSAVSAATAAEAVTAPTYVYSDQGRPVFVLPFSTNPNASLGNAKAGWLIDFAREVNYYYSDGRDLESIARKSLDDMRFLHITMSFIQHCLPGLAAREVGAAILEWIGSYDGTLIACPEGGKSY